LATIEEGTQTVDGDDNRSQSAPFHPDLVWHEEMVGHRPGDRVIRIARHRYFRGVAPTVLQPQPEAVEPHDGFGRFWWKAKQLLIGEPIPTLRESEERLTKLKALAVLSSDALSSVAYATEAAMRVLLLAGLAALSLTLPISIAIALLMVIVAISYQQTVRAYPGGGGSYVVAHENLGVIPGLTAAASLLVDYVLTVAVSIAAGILALVSAFPQFAPHQLELSIAAVILVTVLNLRGVRESGTVFALPTYVFLVSILALIAIGIFRLATGGIPYQPDQAASGAGGDHGSGDRSWGHHALRRNRSRRERGLGHLQRRHDPVLPCGGWAGLPARDQAADVLSRSEAPQCHRAGEAPSHHGEPHTRAEGGPALPHPGYARWGYPGAGDPADADQDDRLRHALPGGGGIPRLPDEALSQFLQSPHGRAAVTHTGGANSGH